MFSRFPQTSLRSGSEDSESSNESPPTFQTNSKPPTPPDSKISGEDPSCTWDLQRSQDLAFKLLAAAESLVEKEVAAFDSSVPPPSLVGSINPRFKTEFCRNYKEKGSCFYGDHCQFAHGPEEIRVIQGVSSVGHRNYKTKLCQKYWIRGYCSYGPRCNFIHETDSNKNKMRNSDLNMAGFNIPESRLPPDNLLGQRSEKGGAISFHSPHRDLAFFLPSYNPERAPAKKPCGPIGSGRPSDKDKKPGV